MIGIRCLLANRARCFQESEEIAKEDVAESSTAKHVDNAKVFDFWGVANALADSVRPQLTFLPGNKSAF